LQTLRPRTLRALYIVLAAMGTVALARAILGFALGPNEAATVGSALPNLFLLLIVGTFALLISLLSLVNGSAAGTKPP
jgi:hypothetical protein